jgi:hypothetical protein
MAWVAEALAAGENLDKHGSGHQPTLTSNPQSPSGMEWLSPRSFWDGRSGKAQHDQGRPSVLLFPGPAQKIVALLIASPFDRKQWQFVDCTG